MSSRAAWQLDEDGSAKPARAALSLNFKLRPFLTGRHGPPSPQITHSTTTWAWASQAGRSRGVNKDGTFNVRRVGLPRFRPYELYHHLITMGWAPFLGLLFLAFLVTNALFALLYLGIGMEHFRPAGRAGSATGLLDAFFFSAQTLTTVGYGHISPRGPLASAAAALESLLGLLSFALATGLLYGRFSRPQACLRFSVLAVVAPYQEISGLHVPPRQHAQQPAHRGGGHREPLLAGDPASNTRRYHAAAPGTLEDPPVPLQLDGGAPHR